ncbi:MAG: zinc ribbon domain-containing protein [Actinomycetota bacterium]|nr:zinc ribbon domain-containing protein [Actinomycetota bacterium]
MRFIDYKCNDCNEINEYYINSEDDGKLNCPKCGSSNLTRVFAAVQCKCQSGSSEGGGSYSSGKSCSGSCSGCSGCS